MVIDSSVCPFGEEMWGDFSFLCDIDVIVALFIIMLNFVIYHSGVSVNNIQFSLTLLSCHLFWNMQEHVPHSATVSIIKFSISGRKFTPKNLPQSCQSSAV